MNCKNMLTDYLVSILQQCIYREMIKQRKCECKVTLYFCNLLPPPHIAIDIDAYFVHQATYYKTMEYSMHCD